jgi:hypothetical protein
MAASRVVSRVATRGLVMVASMDCSQAVRMVV